MVGRPLLLCLALLGGIVACGVPAPCEDTASMGRSVDGLVVVPEEHADGWGRADCESCHVLQALHRRACAPGVDYAELRELVQTDGYAVCAECHGDNGVEP